MREPRPATPPARRPAPLARPGWSNLLGLVAAAIPFCVALSRAATGPQWRADLPSVRDLGLVAMGFGGGVSTLVTQALALLPVGSLTFRASLGSVLALAVAAYLLFAIAREALEATGASHRLAAVLSAIAAATAALSHTWQLEATIGGGAMLGVACALAAVRLAVASAKPPPPAMRAGDLPPLALAPAPGLVALGAALGATLAESPPAFASALVASASVAFATRPHVRPPARAIGLALAALVATALLFSTAPLVRPYAPRSFADLGPTLSAAGLAAVDVAAPAGSVIEAYYREIGLVSMAMAGFGIAAAVALKRGRPFALALAALVALDLTLPASFSGVMAADPLTSLRSLAVAGLALASSIGLATALSLLDASRLPLAKPARALLVAFHMTLVSLASEQAGAEANRADMAATEEFTDLALTSLEPNAAVLVRSKPLAWRLWAARLARGERPDVLVVPAPLLGRGKVASALATNEPAVLPLLRDHALVGGPTEFSLSTLADARPVHLEFHRGWPKRVYPHLTPSGVWLDYAAQPVGASDRRASLEGYALPLQRVEKAAGNLEAPDAATAALVAQALRGQALVLGMVGDTKTAGALAADATRIAPEIDGLAEAARAANGDRAGRIIAVPRQASRKTSPPAPK